MFKNKVIISNEYLGILVKMFPKMTVKEFLELHKANN